MRIFIFATILFLTATQPISAQTNSQIYFPTDTHTITIGDSTTITVGLDSTDLDLTGADTVLTYDSQLIEINHIEFNQPANFAHNFYSLDASDPENSTIHTTSVFSNPDSTVSTKSPFFTIFLTAKELGTPQIKFDCSDNSTTDSNLIQTHTTDIIDCSSLKPLEITIIPIGEKTTIQPASSNTSCTTPESPQKLQALAVDSDTILLQWLQNPLSSSHSLYYGTSSYSFTSGIANLNLSSQLLINHLSPNTTYYFALASQNDCTSSTLTFANTTTTSTPILDANSNTQTPNDINQPQIKLTTTELEAIPSLDRLLTTQNTHILLDPREGLDETPVFEPKPQLTIILLAFVGITPIVIYLSLKSKKLI